MQKSCALYTLNHQKCLSYSALTRALFQHPHFCPCTAEFVHVSKLPSTTNIRHGFEKNAFYSGTPLILIFINKIPALFQLSGHLMVRKFYGPEEGGPGIDVSLYDTDSILSMQLPLSLLNTLTSFQLIFTLMTFFKAWVPLGSRTLKIAWCF